MNVKTKTYFISIAVAFVVGCICTGCIVYHVSDKRATESNRQLSKQYTDAESKLNETITSLKESIKTEQQSYTELANRLDREKENYNKLADSIEQQRNAIITVVESIKSSGDSVRDIKQAVQKIRDIIKILEEHNIDNSPSISNNNNNISADQ